MTADCLEDVEEKIADTRLRKAVDSGLSMSDHNARSSGGAETSVTIFCFCCDDYVLHLRTLLGIGSSAV